MDTREINKALNDAVVTDVYKAIEEIDNELYNSGLKDLLSRIVAKYERVLFGDVGVWVYDDRVEIYNHITITKEKYKHECKGLLVVGYDSVANNLGNMGRVQFTRESYLKVDNGYELSERVDEVAIGLRDSKGRERNHGVVMGVLGKLSDTYDLVGIRNIEIRKVC